MSEDIPYEIMEGDTPGTYFLYVHDYDYLTGHIAEIHGPNAAEEVKLFAAAPATKRQRDAYWKALEYLGGDESVRPEGLDYDIRPSTTLLLVRKVLRDEGHTTLLAEFEALIKSASTIIADCEDKP